MISCVSDQPHAPLRPPAKWLPRLDGCTLLGSGRALSFRIALPPIFDFLSAVVEHVDERARGRRR